MVYKLCKTGHSLLFESGEGGKAAMRPPRNLEEWLYCKLLESEGFHRFVRKVYNKVNGIKETPLQHQANPSEFLYKPTRLHKFRAYRMLFWDEMRASLNLPKKSSKFLK